MRDCRSKASIYKGKLFWVVIRKLLFAPYQSNELFPSWETWILGIVELNRLQNYPLSWLRIELIIWQSSIHQAEQFSFIPLSSSFLCFVCLYSSLGNNCGGKTTCSSNRKNDNVCRRNVSETSTDVVIRRNCFLLSDEVGVLWIFF